MMLMLKMGVLEMEKKFEINCFLLFSVSCQAESGEAGHRGHRRIFPLLVRRSLSFIFLYLFYIFYPFYIANSLYFLSFIFLYLFYIVNSLYFYL